MMTIRQWHTYIGLFTAPSVLFFTLTGALQLYSLHEAHGSYNPPALIEKLSSVHKDQVFEFGDHHPKEADAAENAPPPPDADDAEGKTKVSTLLLKGFFLLVALSLSVSTAFGLWMGLTHPRNRKMSWSLVIAGTLIPLVLLLL
jgi:hypothetical protein